MNEIQAALQEMRTRMAGKVGEPLPKPVYGGELIEWANRIEAALSEHGGGGEAVDKGPWRWEYDRNKTEDARLRGDGAYELQSEDFTHDVRILVSGDFAGHEDVTRYMRWLQATLNAATTPPPQPRGEGVVPSEKEQVVALSNWLHNERPEAERVLWAGDLVRIVRLLAAAPENTP